MASSKMFFILAIVAAFVPSNLAVDYVVGDDAGWKLKVSYTEWAKGKEFHVGDNLIFKYVNSSHNVIKITDKPTFDNCKIPNDATPLNTGNDVIPLKTTGKKWYICGASGHCDAGQKLAITVLAEGPGTAPSPGETLPPPPSAATGRTVTIYYGLVAVMVAFVGIIMV